MGESAFNLAIWQDRLVDESRGIDPSGAGASLGTSHCYMWAYDVNRLGTCSIGSVVFVEMTLPSIYNI